MQRERVTQRYLEHYAEPEARRSYALSQRFENVLVVPAYAEPAALLHGLEPALSRATGKALLILVVNSAVDSPEEATRRTRKLLRTLYAQSPKRLTLSLDPPIDELCLGSVHVLIVDRSSQNFQLGAKQGVGLARRIGCDLALRLISEGCVRIPWIASTDADVSLPVDYFNNLSDAHDSASALVFPFAHTAPSAGTETDTGFTPQAIFDATLLHECSLRYLVLGLAFAGSPYAFHTIGSTLAISARAYAEARGFPRRLAGEDFHLLNKLAKLAPIVRPKCAPVLIRSRLSTRTPFGTGPSVQQLLAGEPAAVGTFVQPRAFYHPDVFVGLAAWLKALERFALDAEVPTWQPLLDEHLPRPIRATLAMLFSDPAFQADLGRALQQHKTPEQRLRHVYCWFDALRCVQLLRQLEAACRKLHWQEALALAPFIEARQGPCAPAELAARLALQEGKLAREIGPTLLGKIG